MWKRKEERQLYWAPSQKNCSPFIGTLLAVKLVTSKLVPVRRITHFCLVSYPFMSKPQPWDGKWCAWGYLSARDMVIRLCTSLPPPPSTLRIWIQVQRENVELLDTVGTDSCLESFTPRYPY
jgi:hypothetical protein